MLIHDINNIQISKHKNIKFLNNSELNFLIKAFKETHLKNIENKQESNYDKEDHNTLIDFHLDNFNFSNKLKTKIKNLKNSKSIIYKFDNTIIKINIFYNKITNVFIHKLINLINFIVNIFNKIKKRNIININLLNINSKKFINLKRKNQLISDNINSGYTQSDFINPDNDFIVLYRLEEINKVLTHEMIHLYKLHTSYKFSHQELYDIFKSSNKHFSIYESFTEVLATIIYTFYFTHTNNLNFNKIMNLQLKFSFLQSAKILLNQNISNIYNMKHINIVENTNAISYYLFKNIILNNFNDFKDLFYSNKNILLDNKNKVIQYDNTIIDSYNINYKRKVLKYIQELEKNKLGNNNNLIKTFRMNILD